MHLAVITGISLILSACLPAEKEQAFFDLYPGAGFNQEVALVPDSMGTNSGYLGSWINLIFENQPSKVVSFSLLEDTSIYTFSERTHNWTKLENQLEYNPGEDILYPKGTEQAVTDKLVVFFV
jgi:hypothetical protein